VSELDLIERFKSEVEEPLARIREDIAGLREFPLREAAINAKLDQIEASRDDIERQLA
jgi:hypothetical protein